MVADCRIVCQQNLLKHKGLTPCWAARVHARFDWAHITVRGFLHFRAQRASCAGPSPRRRPCRAIPSGKRRREPAGLYVRTPLGALSATSQTGPVAVRIAGCGPRNNVRPDGLRRISCRSSQYDGQSHIVEPRTEWTASSSHAAPEHPAGECPVATEDGVRSTVNAGSSG
jgi:hypothetical protein